MTSRLFGQNWKQWSSSPEKSRRRNSKSLGIIAWSSHRVVVSVTDHSPLPRRQPFRSLSSEPSLCYPVRQPARWTEVRIQRADLLHQLLVPSVVDSKGVASDCVETSRCRAPPRRCVRLLRLKLPNG